MGRGAKFGKQEPWARGKQPPAQGRPAAGREAAWHGVGGCFLREDTVCLLVGTLRGGDRGGYCWLGRPRWQTDRSCGKIRRGPQPVWEPARQGRPVPPSSETRLPFSLRAAAWAEGPGRGGGEQRRVCPHPAWGVGKHASPSSPLWPGHLVRCPRRGETLALGTGH